MPQSVNRRCEIQFSLSKPAPIRGANDDSASAVGAFEFNSYGFGDMAALSTMMPQMRVRQACINPDRRSPAFPIDAIGGPLPRAAARADRTGNPAAQVVLRLQP